MAKYSLGLAGPDLNQMMREYGNVPVDDRFTMAMMQTNWRQLQEALKEGEPDCMLVYADIAPSPEDLRKYLSQFKRGIAVVLLPPAWSSVQGVIEQVHTVRRVFLTPANPAEILKFVYSAIETEYAKGAATSALSQVYSGGPRAAAAVGTRVIALLSAQGGVGRTTIAEAIGFELAARRNIRTLLFACDLPSPTPLHLGLRYGPNASEFFARPGINGFRDSVQTTADGLDVIVAPDDSYAYAAAAKPDPMEPMSLRSLVISSYQLNYGAIVLDLPSGEESWTLQPLIAANTVIIVSRPTMDGIKSVAHTAKLITESIGQHSVPRDAVFVVLNMRTNKSTFTPTAFNQEGSNYRNGWFPPVLATIDYDSSITQAQDAGRPAVSVSDALAKNTAALVESFFGGASGVPGNNKGSGKGINVLGVRIKTG